MQLELNRTKAFLSAAVKAGAMKSGTYVKDKSVAGATYLKEKDWTKEKEIAGHAGQAAKTWVCIDMLKV